MRKVITFNLISLDGYFSKPDGELDWHRVDDEFFEFSILQLDSVDMLLLGRVTYQGMASYWTTPEALRDAPVITKKMNEIPKIAFSRTLASADWQNTRLVKDNIVEEVNHLKQQPGKDLIIFGSANLTASFMGLGLIDEFRLIVNPVVLGSGVPFFRGNEHTRNLKLTQSRTFRSGNVLLYYQPEN